MISDQDKEKSALILNLRTYYFIAIRELTLVNVKDGGKTFSFESLTAFRNRENNPWKFKLLNILQGLLPRQTKEAWSVFKVVQTSEDCATEKVHLLLLQKSSSSNFRLTPRP